MQLKNKENCELQCQVFSIVCSKDVGQLLLLHDAG